MRQWFPLTDYDFYAFLSSGVFLIAVTDYALGDGDLIHRAQWSVVQVVFWLAAAYVAGQLIAGPSAAIFEHWIARRVLYPPTEVLLGFSRPRMREKIVNQLFVGHSYSPLPAQTQKLLIDRAIAAHSKEDNNGCTAEMVFQAAYAYARNTPSASSRLDQLQNTYGFNRNLACVALIATAMLSWRYFARPTPDISYLLPISILVLVGAFGRFIKYYSAFAQEVLRTFGFAQSTHQGG